MLVVVDQHLLHSGRDAGADWVQMSCQIGIVCCLMMRGPEDVSNTEDQQQDQNCGPS
jgi:hypothetical protein